MLITESTLNQVAVKFEQFTSCNYVEYSLKYSRV